MRKIHYHKKLIPGDIRVRSVFLWLPTRAINKHTGFDETRWLERALVKETYLEIRGFAEADMSTWKVIQFINE